MASGPADVSLLALDTLVPVRSGDPELDIDPDLDRVADEEPPPLDLADDFLADHFLDPADQALHEHGADGRLPDEQQSDELGSSDLRGSDVRDGDGREGGTRDVWSPGYLETPEDPELSGDFEAVDTNGGSGSFTSAFTGLFAVPDEAGGTGPDEAEGLDEAGGAGSPEARGSLFAVPDDAGDARTDEAGGSRFAGLDEVGSARSDDAGDALFAGPEAGDALFAGSDRAGDGLYAVPDEADHAALFGNPGQPDEAATGRFGDTGLTGETGRFGEPGRFDNRSGAADSGRFDDRGGAADGRFDDRGGAADAGRFDDLGGPADAGLFGDQAGLFDGGPDDPDRPWGSRAESRYGDRVEGWIRPEYRDEPEPVSGEYWTPVPEGTYDSEYGWPVPVERLPEVPPYPVAEEVAEVESEPTALVPQWPPARPDDRIELPRSWSRRDEIAHREGRAATDDDESPAEEGRGFWREDANRAGTPRFPVNEARPDPVVHDDNGRRVDDRSRRPGVMARKRRGPVGEGPTQAIPAMELGEMAARARPRPRPRPSGGQPEPRSTVYVSRHAAEPS
ncbi:Halomucin [Actinoplanes friuliensis DSM 7358]|uniref:Halomucin n=1 Tax=Actinoplanes friuliensis DSM 7358 TaxID=1246995 RepID=U5WAA5_9ACTN|nr:Halomucin [Actinoplanes friuliensis DSM 7358]